MSRSDPDQWYLAVQRHKKSRMCPKASSQHTHLSQIGSSLFGDGPVGADPSTTANNKLLLHISFHTFLWHSRLSQGSNTHAEDRQNYSTVLQGVLHKAQHILNEIVHFGSVKKPVRIQNVLLRHNDSLS